ncbi:MAG: hypothetical protein ABIE70_13890 [bacterium]
MKCRDVQAQLDVLLHLGRQAETDSALNEHLAACRQCRRLYEASTSLRAIYQSAGTDDREGLVPLQVQRQRIEARARRGDKVRIERRGRLPIAAAAVAAVVLVVAALVPFNYDRIMGYSVAFAGVNYECGADDGVFCEMLYNLGLDDADVDHLGCDSTCHLLVVDLKTQGEVDMVVGAFADLCRDQVDTSVIPIFHRGSSTLLDRAHRRITTANDG